MTIVKNNLSLALAIIFLLVISGPQASARPVTGKIEGDAVRWVDAAFAKGVTPPFSFTLDGTSSDIFLKTWKFKKTEMPSREAGCSSYLFSWTGGKEKIRVECAVDVFGDFDAVKWVVAFKNEGAYNSGRISCQRSLDVSLSLGTGGNFVINTLEGGNISKTDFFPRAMAIDEGQAEVFVPKGGRSSEGAFPFFNIESPDGSGVVMAVGWTGTWTAEIANENGNSLGLSSGLDKFDSYLLSGESFRGPSVCLLFWKGSDHIDGSNKFRRFLTTHVCRKVNGKCAEYPLSCSFNYRDPYPYTEYSGITELWARAMAERYIQFGIRPDVFWLDAGWYEGASDYEHGRSWANTVGNWMPDKRRFPDGMYPVAQTVRRLGAKFMVWFEPERVMSGTEWADKHPEYLLEIPNSDKDTYRLFDLGNNEAREWMTNQIETLIRENGIDYYRQDFNMEPDIYWAANDEENRVGMKEVRHIEGLYEFWDHLLETFPELLIDNCASGGKRLDLETVGRSAPLWRSDYYHIGEPEIFQGQTVGLSEFLPFHGTGTATDDPYLFRSCMSGALVLNWKVTSNNSNVLRMRDNVALYESVKPYYSEDFYPMSEPGNLGSTKEWLAYEMVRPSDDSAVLVAFRRSEAQDPDYTVRLRGLNPDKVYKVYSFDKDEEKMISGEDLMAGFSIHLDEPKSSAVFMIK